MALLGGQMPRRALSVVGAGILVASVIGLAALPGVAGATFGGATVTNGDISFVSNCNGGAQQILYVNPQTVSNPPPPCASYGQQTQVTTDGEPFYNATSTTVYFESSRATTANPGGGVFAIWSVPAIFSGNIGDGTPGDPDGATQITFPTGTQQDYAPTISQDGTRLAFIRCNGTTACALETVLLGGGSPTAETTSFTLTNVSGSENGNEDRPEFDPADGTQVLYECAITISGVAYGHICLHTIGATTGDMDLSSEAETASGGPWAFTDENPDFKYDGSAIVFDTTGGMVSGSPVSGTTIYKMSFNTATRTASAAGPVWPTVAGQGGEIEPIYSPDGTKYAWAHHSSGSKIYTWDVGGIANPVPVSPAGLSISSQPTWQGNAGQGPVLPEAPLAALLPIGGVGVGALAIVFGRRRRRGLLPA